MSGECLQDHWSSGSGLLFIWFISDLQVNEDRHNIFEFWLDQTTGYGVICP